MLWCDDWQPPAPLVVPKPDLAVLLGETQVEEWFETGVRELLDSVNPTSTVVAVGRLARLWSPRRGLAVVEAQRALAGDLSVTDRCREWVVAQLQPLADSLERRALFHEQLLHERLAEFKAVTKGKDLYPYLTELAELAEQRDDLESELWVLKQLGRYQLLESALYWLDQQASWSWAALVQRELLGEVSWIEPDAWWGRVSI